MDKLLQNNTQPERLASAALQSFFNISKYWGLSLHEQQVILGSPPDPIFIKWKVDETAQCLEQDTLCRISYLLGIYKALHTLLPQKAADEWIKKPNNAPFFHGECALSLILDRGLAGLDDVRKYLDVECSN